MEEPAMGTMAIVEPRMGGTVVMATVAMAVSFPSVPMGVMMPGMPTRPVTEARSTDRHRVV